MAVTLDAVTAAGDVLSFSHTCTGIDRYLIVAVIMASNVESATGVTYNGVAMTLLKRQAHPTITEAVELWGLVTPSAGTNTVAITLTNGGFVCSNGAISFTGVDSGTPTDYDAVSATGSAVTDVTSPPKSGVLGDLLVDAVASDHAIAIGPTSDGILAWNDAVGDGQQYKAVVDSTPHQTVWTTGIPCNWCVATALLKGGAAPLDGPPLSMMVWP